MPRKQPLANVFNREQLEEQFCRHADMQDERIDRSLANNEIKNKNTVSGKSNYHLHYILSNSLSSVAGQKDKNWCPNTSPVSCCIQNKRRWKVVLCTEGQVGLRHIKSHASRITKHSQGAGEIKLALMNNSETGPEFGVTTQTWNEELFCPQKSCGIPK